LSDSRGGISITLSRGDDQSLEIFWNESGGPEVQTPTRRGFGSTIIERTIPHELGGAAEVDYLSEGLRATFVIPNEHIAAYDTPMPSQHEPLAVIPEPRDSKPELFSAKAMIVEDNVIIAMEAEDVLRELGFADCHIVGSVRAAQALVEETEVSFAMLDVNLGRETSEEVAVLLQKRGIPFIFASGYGDRSFTTSRFDGVPVVTKPYSERDVRAAIARLKHH
jgi:CheY-like chemotaxis protein